MFTFKQFSKKPRGILSCCGVLLACCLFFSSLTVYADTYEERIRNQQAMSVDTNAIANWPQGPVVTAEAAVLMEAQTGTILYAKNMHKQEYPASCTKLLTCLIAMETCEMDDMVTMSRDAIYDTPYDSNHIALDVGESITMEEALSAILIRSANEVSFGVAEHITQTSWEDFGEVMNKRAEELGCLNSHFVNPNGLPHTDHYTTAYDLALIAKAFFQNESLSKLSRTTKLELLPTATQPDHIIEHSKNLILSGRKYAYADLLGSKTGYTDVARHCLVSCAERDGMKLICVVLKDESPYHYEDTVALFEYGFQNFTVCNVASNETKYHIDTTDPFYSENEIFGNTKPLLALNTEDFIILPRTADFSQVSSVLSYDTLSPDQAALITYTWNGAYVGTASVDFLEEEETSYDFETPAEVPEESIGTPSENQGPSVVFVNIGKILLRILGAVILLLLLVFLFFLIRYLVIVYLRKRKKRRRRRRSSSTSSSVQRSVLAYDRQSVSRARRNSIRSAKARRRRQAKRPNRFRDYDF